MTTLLQQAFAEAAKRSPQEQDVLAARMLAELAAEDAFDQALAASTDTLAGLSRQAIEEFRAGRTQELELPSS